MKTVFVVLLACICLDICHSSIDHSTSTKSHNATIFQGMEKTIVSANPATGVALQYGKVNIEDTNMKRSDQKYFKKAIRVIYDDFNEQKHRLPAFQKKLHNRFHNKAYVVINFENIGYYSNDLYIHFTIDGDNVFGVVSL